MKSVSAENLSDFACRDMWKQEGAKSFWKGITPRVMRVAPGQAVTFTVYEYLKGVLERGREMIPGGQYEE